MAVRPFQFTGLPRFTQEQVALQQSMAIYLSFKPFRPRFRHTLAGALGRYLKAPCEISSTELKPINRYEIGIMLPEVACLFVVNAGPAGHKLLVEVDPNLAMFAVERLLGGSGDGSHMRRPLTEIEEGVLSFLVLKTLSQFQDGWETGRELPLTLDRFAASIADLDEFLEAEPMHQLLGFRIAAGRKTGYVRVLVPQSLITTTFASPVPQHDFDEHERAYARRVLPTLGSSQSRVRLEIARLDLSAADRANVEPGDIIVLENAQIALSEAGVTGEVFARIGRGENGGFQAEVVPHSDHVRLRVLQIVQQEQPQEGSMSDAEDYGDDPQEVSAEALDEVSSAHSVVPQQDHLEETSGLLADDLDDTSAPLRDPLEETSAPLSDNLEETSGLLRDVEAPVVVELGRLRMNTAQVVRLRAGQVLRLNRGPKDPVSLVVNGKIFARGELVEVDGELGVRLLQVVGAG